MLNQVILVGRLVEKPTKEKVEEKNITQITLAVPRSYKNADGEYETDFIDCTLWNEIADNVCEWCDKGDLIGIKGRIEQVLIGDDESKLRDMRIIAEKVTFLSSKVNKKTKDE